MNIKISKDIVENLGKNFLPIQNKTGTMINTYTENDIQYMSVKIDNTFWDVPRKYCLIQMKNGLTNVL